MTKVMSPDLRLTLGIPFEIENTQRAHLDHQMMGVNLGVEKTWENGLITSLSLGYSVDNYEGAYPLFGEPRRDRIATASLALRHRDIQIGSFIPEVTVTFMRSRSNIDFFDYSRHDVGLSMSQRF